MENRTIVQRFESELIDSLKKASQSKKMVFTFEDCKKLKNIANRREEILINTVEFLKNNPLKDNDYYKFVNAYFENGIKLNEKYFRHDINKLNEYYSKIDENNRKSNPFNKVAYENYVLYMALKLNGVYESNDDFIFNVKNLDNREYNPLTKIPSVLRGCLPFKVKEFDIIRAFPSFIDIELETDFRKNVYDKITKKEFAMYLNSNCESKISIDKARNGLKSIYNEFVSKVITDIRYNEKGRLFKDLAKYEKEHIEQFVKANEIKNFARLHDGVFVLDNAEVSILDFGKVSFSIKESIHPKIENSIISFYYLDGKNNVITSPSMYADFLKQENFIRLKSHDDKIQLLKDSNNVIDFFNHKTDLVSFLESQINEVNKKNVRDKLANDNRFTLQESLKLLEPIKMEYYKDSKSNFGLPFKNGFFYFDEIDLFEIKQLEYKDVKGFFAPHPIQQRQFKYTNETSDFELFINRIITGEKEPCLKTNESTLNAFYSMIGYLCHKFKTLSQTVCIVLTDEGANDETRNGGRGKTLIGLALEQVVNSIIKGGSEFVGSYVHNFADLDEKVNLYRIDDVPAGFNYNDLYTNISGGINIQPKGTKARLIDFSDTPKFLITTNWLFRYREDDTSTNRRFYEYKIKDYYKIGFTPKDEFKQTFFEDWDEQEWNRFYSFIFRCVRFFIQNGLQKIHYDKTDDNFRASFGSDLLYSEMERIMTKLIYPSNQNGTNKFNPIESFNVSDFLKIYYSYDSPHRTEKLFHQKNTKTLIDIYLSFHKEPKYNYKSNSKKWFLVTQKKANESFDEDGLIDLSDI
jgi:hypothetical protein